MTRYLLYVHPYCISSYKVVRYLLERDALDKITVVSLISGNPLSLEKIIPSVPALEVNGKIVAIDPLEPEFVKNIINGLDVSVYVPLNDEQIIKRFIDSVLASSYIAIQIYFGGMTVNDIIHTSFIEYALRTYFSKLDLNRVRKVLLNRINYIHDTILKVIPRIVAINYLRDLSITRGGKIDKSEAFDERKLMLWSIAKNSMGRSFTPLLDHTMKNIEKYYVILDILKEKFYEYYTKIINEYSRIRSDEQIYKILIHGHNMGM